MRLRDSSARDHTRCRRLRSGWGRNPYRRTRRRRTPGPRRRRSFRPGRRFRWGTVGIRPAPRSRRGADRDLPARRHRTRRCPRRRSIGRAAAPGRSLRRCVRCNPSPAIRSAGGYRGHRRRRHRPGCGDCRAGRGRSDRRTHGRIRRRCPCRSSSRSSGIHPWRYLSHPRRGRFRWRWERRGSLPPASPGP